MGGKMKKKEADDLIDIFERSYGIIESLGEETYHLYLGIFYKGWAHGKKYERENQEAD